MSTIDLFALGRGRSALTLEGQHVIKVASRWEPAYMRRYPEAFIPVLWNDTETLRYAMPLCVPSHPDHLEAALVCGANKLRVLWGQPRVRSTRSSLLAHLQEQVDRHHLNVNIRTLAWVARSVQYPHKEIEIHGDPTLANIVFDGKTWWWIDPLDRSYIPGDPHVDLGKMFQSCLGYENALLGQPRVERFDVMRRLARQCNLSYELGRLWCYIHIVRLLPYQDRPVRTEFERVLQEWK